MLTVYIIGKASYQVVKFGGVKNYIPIFNCMEVGAPNPCMVQESTIYTSF